ncbi:LysR substrate-binding domain-containing protein [soil metagenome]
MFELAQLRCFVVLAQELHFGRAASRLNMTQPPLSRQIQLLEHAVGARLFDRTSRAVSLTSSGRSFQPDAVRILELSDKAVATARRTAKGESGTLTIGFTTSSGSGVLPSLLIECRKRLPDVQFDLLEMVTTDQIEALSSGRLDVGLLWKPVPSDFESVVLRRERMVAALPKEHPRAKGPAPMLSDFDRKPFIMYSPYQSRYFHELVASMFHEQQIAPDYVQHVAYIHTMISLVSAGMGAAVVPDSSRHFSDKVIFRPLPVFSKQLVERHLAWSPDNRNPILQPVIEVARALSAASVSTG